MPDQMADRAPSVTRALSAARHEPRDVSLRFFMLLLSGIGCVLVLLMALAYEIFPGEVRDARFAGPFPAFPAPQLQPDPAADWQTFYARELAWLNSAGWQDRKAGVVHIPIDQAMRAVASEGIRGWPTGNTAASQGDRR